MHFYQIRADNTNTGPILPMPKFQTGSDKKKGLIMKNEEKPFEVTKTFGLGVLLKLTKKNVRGIEISSNGKTFTSNVSLLKLTDAVNATIKAHHISLKIR